MDSIVLGSFSTRIEGNEVSIQTISLSLDPERVRAHRHAPQMGNALLDVGIHEDRARNADVADHEVKADQLRSVFLVEEDHGFKADMVLVDGREARNAVADFLREIIELWLLGIVERAFEQAIRVGFDVSLLIHWLFSR